MLMMMVVLYSLLACSPLVPASVVLRRWSLQMEETIYWWQFQEIEEKWSLLASSAVVYSLVAGALGVMMFHGL